MTDDPAEGTGPQGLMRVLLAPLHVAGDVGSIASALVSLERDVRARLASVDQHAGALVRAVGGLMAPLERIDRKVTELQKLDESIAKQREDMNTRMLALEDEVRGMNASADRRHVARPRHGGEAAPGAQRRPTRTPQRHPHLKLSSVGELPFPGEAGNDALRVLFYPPATPLRPRGDGESQHDRWDARRATVGRTTSASHQRYRNGR